MSTHLYPLIQTRLFASRLRNWLFGVLALLIALWMFFLRLNVNAAPQTLPQAAHPSTSISASIAGDSDSDAAFDAPTYSSPIALSADKQYIWVVNPDDDSVSVIGDLAGTPYVVKKIEDVGDEPQSIALDGAGNAYVANAADNSVAIIKVKPDSDGFDADVVESFVTGAEPLNIVASPDGKRIFVANSAQDTITVIETDHYRIVGHVDLRRTACNGNSSFFHFQPRGLAVTADSKRLYVTRFLSFTKAGGVQGNDLGKEGLVCLLSIPDDPDKLPKVLQAIRLAAQDTGFTIDANGDGVADPTSAFPNQLQSIVIRGNQAYLPNIAASPSRPLRFNVDTHAFVNVIDNAVSGTPSDASAAKFLNLHLGARLPEAGKKRLFFANPWAIAFTTQSGPGIAYAVSAGSDLLVKVNVDDAGKLSFTGGGTTTRYIDLNDPNDPATSGANAGKNPLGIVIVGNRAFVMNFVSRNVSVVDLTTDKVIQAIQTAELPDPGSQEEQVQVGAEMFFSSRGHFDRPAGTTVSTDERLSSEGWQNCASCHFAGLTDGVVWQFGTGPRKSVPLNATYNPHNRDQQRVLNYSAIFDEVQDFEANIRNVSGPGPLPAPVNGSVLDPDHGLLISDTGNINFAPAVLNAFALANAGRPQHTVTLPGSSKAWPALDALNEWVRFAVRTPNGALTRNELKKGGGDRTGGLSDSFVKDGRRLFDKAGCDSCHGTSHWTSSRKDFVSPPAAAEITVETDPNAAGVFPDPNGNQFLARFLKDIGSFNLNVPGQGNILSGQPAIGAVEKDTANRDALGLDYNNDGKGAGFNVPSLLGIWGVQPYYHNGACETLLCVLNNVTHRTAGSGGKDVLKSSSARAKLFTFLQTIDAETKPFDDSDSLLAASELDSLAEAEAEETAGLTEEEVLQQEAQADASNAVQQIFVPIVSQ